MKLFAAFKLLVLILAVFAVLSTGLWLNQARTFSLVSQSGVLSLLLLGMTACGTCLNLALRWFRWHFLLRRFDVRLRTRDSLLVYVATLPAILTPFYLGELVRSLAFARKEPGVKRQSVKVWLTERGTDAAMLAAVCIWKVAGGWLALLALCLTLAALILLLRSMRPTTAADTRSASLLLLASTLLATTLVSWSLPMAALWAASNSLGGAVSVLDSAFAFSASTLMGGISGVPGGIAVAGSAEILLLEQGQSLSGAAWTVAIFRLGTVWFSVALGAALLLFKRSAVLASIARSTSDHFDELAEEYEGELASHTREKLLLRKVDFMQNFLQERWPRTRLRGLDIGCGQGWYASAMARHGHRMVGLDLSRGQLEHAVVYAARQGVRLDLLAARAGQLPFQDGSFDFIYSINVLHHVLDEAQRESCYTEIVRILKPGGVFLLHEMNIENPLFRLYLSYFYPLLTRIDEGNERWISPSALPALHGARWEQRVAYFTFLPDFIPEQLAKWLSPFERRLELSPRWSKYSAHYLAVLAKGLGPAEGSNRATSDRVAGAN